MEVQAAESSRVARRRAQEVCRAQEVSRFSAGSGGESGRGDGGGGGIDGGGDGGERCGGDGGGE